MYDLKGEYDQAREHIRRSLKLAQRLGHQEALPVIVCNLASVEANRGKISLLYLEVIGHRSPGSTSCHSV